MKNDLQTLSKSQLIRLLEAEQTKARTWQQRLKVEEGTGALAPRADRSAQTDAFWSEAGTLRGQRANNPYPLPPARSRNARSRPATSSGSVTCVGRPGRGLVHPGRLPLPEHLPVEEVEIYPEGDLSGMVCIGTEVTEELEMDPARFYIRRYIRYKYAPRDKEKDGVRIGELPERVIDKGIPGPGLLAGILTDKYVDHLPLYRQRQRFEREGITIPASTLDGWARQGMERLELLYQALVTDTKTQGYLQADETPIKVLDPGKKGTTHQG